jgi:2-C-methyl-D-erythritol 4-phosphate cytidylyltransferase
MTDQTLPIADLKLKTYAVIVAGGSGTRMQSALPKQFLSVNGKPLLMHTIEAFYSSSMCPQIILVLNSAYHDVWKELCAAFSFNINHTLIAGGETRFHSVKNAIDLINDKDVLIAVHDAVRPMVTTDIIDRAYSCAAVYGSAITAVKSRDSVRQTTETTSFSLNRDEIYLVQTPQTFQSELLRKAYGQPYSHLFTDDASVVEQNGMAVTLIEGSYSNIKVTFAEDIAIAEVFLKQKSRL